MTADLKDSRVLVTGGSGMVGTALKEELPNAKYLSSSTDLCEAEAAEEAVSSFKPKYVIHLAARVGGIKANTRDLGSFYYSNIMINANVLEACRKFNVTKVISMLSTCIYPNHANYPLTEEQIHCGEPHESNFAYAYAKRMLDVQSRAYRKQYGSDFITAVPNNLFGENDNFNLEDSHVIPAIIRKMYEAEKQKSSVGLWGDGSAMREFTYSKDLAKIIVFLLGNYSGEAPLNVGNTKEYSVRQVAEMIAEILNFSGEIIWEEDQPSGQMRKPSDNSKLKELYDKDMQYTDFRFALENVCQWFCRNYPNVRGVQ